MVARMCNEFPRTILTGSF